MLADIDSRRVRNPISLLNDRTILRHWLHPRWHIDSAVISGYSHAFTDEHAIVVAHLRLAWVLLSRYDYFHWRNSLSFIFISLEVIEHFCWLFVDWSILRIRCSVFPLVGYPSLYSYDLIVHSAATVEHLLAHIYTVADHFLAPAVI